MQVADNIKALLESTKSYNYTLVAVSKTKPNELILDAYEGGQRVFGENKVQELTEKYDSLPKDIEWHMIGHLQSNKVKYIASFVSLIHAVDSFKLLKEIDKQAKKCDRVINCLLQLHIADEESKFGFSFDEVVQMVNSEEFKSLSNVKIVGVMGMATNTNDTDKIRQEFRSLKAFFEELKSSTDLPLQEISMGMSGDYEIALEEGSTMIRIGSSLFGARNYH